MLPVTLALISMEPPEVHKDVFIFYLVGKKISYCVHSAHGSFAQKLFSVRHTLHQGTEHLVNGCTGRFVPISGCKCLNQLYASLLIALDMEHMHTHYYLFHTSYNRFHARYDFCHYLTHI